MQLTWYYHLVLQGTHEDMDEDDEGDARFRAFSGSARTLAGAAGHGRVLLPSWGRTQGGRQLRGRACNGKPNACLFLLVSCRAGCLRTHPLTHPLASQHVQAAMWALRRSSSRGVQGRSAEPSRLCFMQMACSQVWRGAEGLLLQRRRRRPSYPPHRCTSSLRHFPALQSPWGCTAVVCCPNCVPTVSSLSAQLTTASLAMPLHDPSTPFHPPSPPLPLPPKCNAVDDGEPRDMRDPANLGFMEAIMRGQLPPELDPGDPNVQVGGGGVHFVAQKCTETHHRPPPYKGRYLRCGHRIRHAWPDGRYKGDQ